jgi:hypothetical protein
MIFNVSGGGGTALNFRVVGGTTAPSNHKENMIWVNTSTTISSWVFSATQPTAATGKVWITTGTSSTVEFNALKKNGIQVYPIAAKQYVSGAWVEKEAKSYQGSAWVEWIRYLYIYGDEYTGFTGGWYVNRNNGATLTKNADNMVFTSASSQSSSSITMQKGTDIDYGRASVIHVTFEKFESTHTYHNVELTFRTGVNHDSATTISNKLINYTFSNEATFSLPIPSNTTKAFCIYVYAGTATIKKIWLE